MSREIKFEFIISNEGKKHLSREYTIEDLIDMGDHYKIIEDMETCTCSMNESTNHCEGDCLQFENAEIIGKRQYTGLKDKNGVDIYEGDIVKWKCGMLSGTSKIAFEDAAFRLIDYFNRDENNITQNWMGKYSEVIGNIYENETTP